MQSAADREKRGHLPHAEQLVDQRDRQWDTQGGPRPLRYVAGCAGIELDFGVALSWPIFQGGLTSGQSREARANLDVARANLSQAELDVRLDVRQGKTN